MSERHIKNTNQAIHCLKQVATYVEQQYGKCMLSDSIWNTASRLHEVLATEKRKNG